MYIRHICILFSISFFVGCKPTQVITPQDNQTNVEATDSLPEEPKWASKYKEYKYQASRERKTDLLHTILRVSFDWNKQYLNGIATLKLTPYFYPQTTVELDAKGFDIQSIKLLEGSKKTSLKYVYSSDNNVTKGLTYPEKLIITLPREFKKGEEYTIEIDYTAKPNELLEGGSDAIISDKGLYFINPKGEVKDKPRQIWTQGETEASSCWFPTIDAPNEKTTQEMYITVDTSMITLSNGFLKKSEFGEDNTRTDYWVMDKPHAPYLFMMTVGEFAKIEDKWNNMEVSYYVEKQYAPYARLVFGNTPEMLQFFSTKLNYPYPWPKYAQIAVRDYVSGAMENTSASIFLEQIQLNNREVLDKNWDYIIAHELFHHWFGDLTTCESWSNLALNESFANYSEYLWAEYKYGRDAADFHAEKELEEYLEQAINEQEPIIRFHYEYRDDMFDRHSYNKGGRVLHMLRKHIGDDAFFASLHLFLSRYEYQPVEIHHLRLCFEEVTGQDLNWFFNQWFLSPGHPQLEVKHQINDTSFTVQVSQLQNLKYTPLYEIPARIDYWMDGKQFQEEILINDTIQTFTVNTDKKPELVLFDGEQMILGQIKEDKETEQYLKQYQLSHLYLARKEALLALTTQPYNVVQTSDGPIRKVIGDTLGYNTGLLNPQIRETLTAALDDNFYVIRVLAIDSLMGYKGKEGRVEIITKVKELALSDSAATVRARAMTFLSGLENQHQYQDIYRKGINDSAYSVVSASLMAYLGTNAPDAEQQVKKLRNINNLNIAKSVAQYYIRDKIKGNYEWFLKKLKGGNPIEKLRFAEFFARYLQVDKQNLEQGIKILEDLAKNNENIYVRFGGYKGLWILHEVQGMNELRQVIREQETNNRLKEAYKRLEEKLL